MQSDKKLTSKIYFFLTLQRMETFPNETRWQVDKENQYCGENQKLINIFQTKKFPKS